MQTHFSHLFSLLWFGYWLLRLVKVNTFFSCLHPVSELKAWGSFTFIQFIQFPVIPVSFTRDLKSQEAEEGGRVTLHCELSKAGVPVEWKRGTQVLKCGEKYQMTQTGCSYELQIFDLNPGDTGGYSCCSEDTESSASLVVNGRMEIASSFHSAAFVLYLIILLSPLLTIENHWLFLFNHQLSQLFSPKSWKAKRLMRGTVLPCTVSSLNLGFLWSGERENLAFALVPSMKLDRQDTMPL